MKKPDNDDIDDELKCDHCGSKNLFDDHRCMECGGYNQ